VQTISGASLARRAVVLHPWVRALSGALKRWQSAFKTWCSERAAINALSALSDRQLKDIELDRSEITRAVRDRAAKTHVYPLLLNNLSPQDMS
jgi:uncharacterized protein YjiS (DUF1127 family)